MNRRERYLESMLTDLGAVYYQTLKGEASEAEVAAAVEAVRSGEAALRPGDRAARPLHSGQAARVPRPRRGTWRVADVMSTDVICVRRDTSYKQVARILAENDLSAVPVVSGGGRVLGMVSEADVLRRAERAYGRLASGLPRRTHRERAQAEALTAEGLMTCPPVTIHPDAPLGAAARLMNGHHVRRLPVVNADGELLGMVSRQDLLNVFLRPDEEIADEIADSLTRSPRVTGELTVEVTDGEVTLSGHLPAADQADAAIRIASEVAGVVDVTSKITVGEAAR